MGETDASSTSHVATPLDQLSAEQLERRQRVIDVAFEMGAEGGYDSVQMRDVAATANVGLATIYRYFSSKDDLLAAAMGEWTGRLQRRVATVPPRGDTAAEQMVDVLRRACTAMERQPKLSGAMLRALSSPDLNVSQGVPQADAHITAMGDEILADIDAQRRADILAVLGHVWYSALVNWANGRRDFSSVIDELERAVHVLVDPYEAETLAQQSKANSTRVASP